MSFANLPPQAYTRDVLAAAYEWLRSQPATVRELATSSDSLVSLYMQSRRRPGGINAPASNGSTASPVGETNPSSMNSASSEAFKKDLRSLAEGLRQFEDSDGKVTSGAQIAAQNLASQVQASLLNSAPLPVTPVMSQLLPPSAHYQAPQTSHSPQTSPSSQTAMPAPSAQTGLSLDSRSLETVRRVQSLLNLSSEREALRMLIAVGFEKVKDLIPGQF